MKISQHTRLVLCIFVTFFFTSSFSFGLYAIFKNKNPARGLFSENTILNKNRIEDGYLLFSPFIAKDNFDGKGKVLLTDLKGNIVHSWKTKYNTAYSIITPEKALYAAQITPSDLGSAPGGGKTGLLQKIDSDGRVLWEYKDEMLHHDFDIDFESGDIYAIKYVPVSESFSSRILGGKFIDNNNFWSDVVIQINQKGEVVWSFVLEQYLNPEDYVLSSITPRNEWSHSNSIRFYKTNPINGRPAVLLSAKHLSTVFLIDKETKKILWKSPKDFFNYQHDATLTDTGTVLAFDNGVTRKMKKFFLWSRLLEIDPRTNLKVWEFKGGDTGIEMISFASSIMSGSQRLPNGNTLGIDSLKGHIFEVTKEGEVVFSFVNPHQAVGKTSPFGNNIFFKARKIPDNYFK